jgi:hypothetical protein
VVGLADLPGWHGLAGLVELLGLLTSLGPLELTWIARVFARSAYHFTRPLSAAEAKRARFLASLIAAEGAEASLLGWMAFKCPLEPLLADTVVVAPLW